MINKVIHYCWFGNNQKPKSVIKCIESWKKYCPDYEIIEWTEKNYDISKNLYCKQAYENKKWAFATDYARLDIIYNYGGIYLDTDVELIRPIDELLKHSCFIGRQPGFQVNTGAGFGAEKGHPLIKIMLDDYKNIPFIKEDGQMDLWTCPHRNSQWLFNNGMLFDDIYQEICNAAIYPIEYFSPKDAYSREVFKTKNTFSIHHCDGSWSESENKFNHAKRFLKIKLKKSIDYFIHLPNMITKRLLGPLKYENFKSFIRKMCFINLKKYIIRKKNKIKFNLLLNFQSRISQDTARNTISIYHHLDKMEFNQNSTYSEEYDLMIIVPVYNVEKYLEECINSIISQETKYKFIAVFIDDGSTDNSGKILEKYTDNEHIKIIHQENRGFSGARNRGLENIVGKYVMFVDSDDFIPENTLELLLNIAYNYDADVVEGRYIYFDGINNTESYKYTEFPDFVSESNLNGYPWGKIIKGTKWINNIFPPNVWFEDTIMKTIIYPECNKFVQIPDIIYNYRINPAGISSTCKNKPNVVDTYWITEFYLEEKVTRKHIFDNEVFKQFLLQIKRNQERLSNMPEKLQESCFVLECQLYKKYFSTKTYLQDSKLSNIIKCIQKTSFKSFKHLIENWNII